jgi:hypothetical protein
MAQRRHQSLAISDVVTFHDTRQVPGRADDERGMHMIIAEELLYLPDGSRQRMPVGTVSIASPTVRTTSSTGSG